MGLITKGLIGQLDFKINSTELYPTDTFVRVNQYGGLITMAAVPDIYKTHTAFLNPRYFSVTAAMTDVSIQAAVTCAAGNGRTVYLEPGSWVISSNLTIPQNINFYADEGAIITINTGCTLTILGPFSAGLYQVFNCLGTGAVSFGSASIREAYPEWWGAKGDFSLDSTAAINSAITAFPTVRLSGKYLVNSTISIFYSGVTLYGNSVTTSQLKFNPNGAGTLIKCQMTNTSQTMTRLVLKDFGFLSTDITHKKVGIDIYDASIVTIDNIQTIDYSWTGGGSIGINFHGRDTHLLKNVIINADKPIVASVNPNTSIYTFDQYHFQDVALNVLATNWAVSFDDQVNIWDWVWDGRSYVVSSTGLGYGVVYFSDSTGVQSTTQISIDNVRCETTAAQYVIYTSGNSTNSISYLNIRNFTVSSSVPNGIYVNNASGVSLTNINIPTTTGTALSVTKTAALKLENFSSRPGATITLTSMYKRYVSYPFGRVSYPTDPSVLFGLYEYYDTDDPSRDLVLMNGVGYWNRTQTTTNGTYVTMPSVSNGGSAFMFVSCDYGSAIYSVNYSAVTKIAGNADFSIAGAGKFTAYAPVNGQ